MPHAYLVLEDGTIIQGNSAGHQGNIFGEIVFNTSMTGYEEAFTDPSYAGQILLMTYPLIGNYGVSKTNYESTRVQIRGLVLKEPYLLARRGLNFNKFLQQARIPCIYNIDTRALTLKIREYGTMKAILMLQPPGKLNTRRIIKIMKSKPHPDQENLVRRVSCSRIIRYGKNKAKRIVLIDCGVKSSIIRNLSRYASVIQVPYDTPIEKIRKYRPDGIMISNGPGNPEHPRIISTTIATIKKCIGRYPIFGVCLGHQLVGIALGMTTYKMKFGHRGSNHAVKHLPSGKVYITSQNHGYALSDTDRDDILIEWRNVNDNTIEGIKHKNLSIATVQFHPEAAPGPYDTGFLFKNFLKVL